MSYMEGFDCCITGIAIAFFLQHLKYIELFWIIYYF